MNKINKVKFFLVAATLVLSMPAAAEVNMDDPNMGIANPQESVGHFRSDTAVDKPISINCTDCDIAAQSGIPLNGYFGVHGSGGNGGIGAGAADQ